MLTFLWIYIPLLLDPLSFVFCSLCACISLTIPIEVDKGYNLYMTVLFFLLFFLWTTFLSISFQGHSFCTLPYPTTLSNTVMAQQEEGWPLGLRLMNARIGLVRNGDFSAGSVSFSTLLTASPTPSTDSSSDLDTQSTRSFFRDRSITLGSLIGIPSLLEFSRRSTRGRMVEPSSNDNKRIHKLRFCFFSLCSKLTTDAVSRNHAPSLGHYLEAERRAANTYRRNQCTTIYGPNDFNPIQDSNSVALQSSASLGEKEPTSALEQNNGYGTPIVFSCLCG